MAAVQQEAAYNFGALLDAMTGVTASATTRLHKVFPTVRQLYDKLVYVQGQGTMYPDHSAAFSQLRDHGMVASAPFTNAQVCAALKGWNVRSRYERTALGASFQAFLRALVYAPIQAPKPTVMALTVRGCVALVPAGFWQTVTDMDIAHQLVDIMYREQCAEVQAQRYIGVGG